MKTLPASPDLSHLKKQAKALLRDALAGESTAVQRFIETLPALQNRQIAALAEDALKLHDAQSVVAREYGFASWSELKRLVEWKRSAAAKRIETWLSWVFEGNSSARGSAIRMLREGPALFADDPWLACVTGDTPRIRQALSADADWVHRPGGPSGMTPLIAVTHSRLILEQPFVAGLLASAELLLRAGADPNATWIDTRFPDSPLPALYGAAGRTHHPAMTRLLLDAGAKTDDGESLYHSVESRDLACTRLLLDAGARVIRTNAIGRVLDFDRLDGLLLLLSHGGDASERPWIHHAILRGRSLNHVRALLDHGADPRAEDDNGVSLFRWALLHGREDVVGLLRERGVDEALSEEDAFVVACTRADEAGARTILARVPDVVARLGSVQLQVMPQLADIGDTEAVRTMLSLGWPTEVKTAWDTTALNLVIFRGDAEMAQLLLSHGADWRTRHGFGDISLGTLSFASRFGEIDDTAPGDYVGCAEALVAAGVPFCEFERYGFSEDVMAFLDECLSATGPQRKGEAVPAL
ncbi:ankyrin repeat domain-containing protein [Methylobacterium brachythecii]|uniref:Ankyrin repeat protein n=1 Tax=Methylobacterium brachythecii TaxID=1176177 RepID=A0A7W6AJY4_9HYPH|nr:hypothetical protein [Methylobacterium brachythecii]MBB3901157.1 ankyrin repeat protein [Methylobacterium brachythecii]GLS44657.1 hypothetical protein GCM10007884_26450 [Methylobacterium brachythecii]